MLQHLAQLIPQLLALSDPCVVLVDEPRTVFYTDGLDVFDAAGDQVLCDIAIEGDGSLFIEAERDVQLTTPKAVLYLDAGETAAISDVGEYSVGYVADPDDPPVPVDVCCYPVLWEDEIVWVCYSCPNAPKIRSMHVISTPCVGMTGPLGGWIDCD